MLIGLITFTGGMLAGDSQRSVAGLRIATLYIQDGPRKHIPAGRDMGEKRRCQEVVNNVRPERTLPTVYSSGAMLARS